MARLTEKAVAEQVRKLRGNMSAVARAFGVTRQSVSEYVGRRPALTALVLDFREERVDNAESALDRAILDGQAWAVLCTLKTLGKDRGYVERQEVTGRDGGGIEVTEVVVRTRAEAAAMMGADAAHPPDPAPG